MPKKKPEGTDGDDEGCQTGVGSTRSMAGAEQEQARSKARVGQKHEQGRNRAGAELSRVKQSRAEREQELGRNEEEQEMCRIGV